MVNNAILLLIWLYCSVVLVVPVKKILIFIIISSLVCTNLTANKGELEQSILSIGTSVSFYSWLVKCNNLDWVNQSFPTLNKHLVDIYTYKYSCWEHFDVYLVRLTFSFIKERFYHKAIKKVIKKAIKQSSFLFFIHKSIYR